MSALDTLNTFELENLPDLDLVALGALEMLARANLPDTSVPFARPLVIGSGNAESTGRIIFEDKDAIFANESNFETALDRVPAIDGAVVISASGSKHAIGIAERLKERGVAAVLFTNNPDAPAASFFAPEDVRVFPKNREPYTYNTSTYMAMILAATKEDPSAILDYLEKTSQTNLDLGSFTGFTFILPAHLAAIAPMLRTKFDELFGTKLGGRFFTPEEAKHAKTVVQDERELFVYVGMEELNWGGEGRRLELALPEGGGLAAALATTYHLIGQIQASHPPYFKENIVRYCEEASAIFGQQINPIVE